MDSDPDTPMTGTANQTQSRQDKLNSLKALESSLPEQIQRINCHLALTYLLPPLVYARLWELVEPCKNDLVRYSDTLRDYFQSGVRLEGKRRWMRGVIEVPRFRLLGNQLVEACELGKLVDEVYERPKTWNATGTTMWQEWLFLLKLQGFPSSTQSRHWGSFGMFPDEDDELQAAEPSELKRKRSITSQGSSISAAPSPSAENAGSSMQPASTVNPLDSLANRSETPLPPASTTGTPVPSTDTAETSLLFTSTTATTPLPKDTSNKHAETPPLNEK